MIRIGRTLPATSHELHPADLEDMAATHDAAIELPAGREGWAYVRVAGQTFRAWVDAPGVRP